MLCLNSETTASALWFPMAHVFVRRNVMNLIFLGAYSFHGFTFKIAVWVNC